MKNLLRYLFGRDNTDVKKDEISTEPKPHVKGSYGATLAKATELNDVVRGDVLRVAYTGFDGQRKEEVLLYTGRNWRFKQFNFHPENPTRDMSANTIILEPFILEWEKLYHITTQEWSAKMAQVFPEAYPRLS